MAATAPHPGGVAGQPSRVTASTAIALAPTSMPAAFNDTGLSPEPHRFTATAATAEARGEASIRAAATTTW